MSESTAAAVEFLRERITRAPRVILILGSGLGGVAEAIQDPVTIRYSEIPGFVESTVAGHEGSIVAGIFEGVEVVALRGRFHLYEGWSPEIVGFPLRVLSALGPDLLVVTNAAGSIRPGLQPGDIMMIADHLNLMFRNPLIGPVAPGEDRFPDMSDPYDVSVRREVSNVAAANGIALETGVYAAVLGPSYETPAEIRMLSRMGADAVGMSTVPEVIVARALGLRVVGFSCISNLAAGIGTEPLGHEEVLEAGRLCGQRLQRLLGLALPRIARSNLATEAAQ